MATLGTYRNPSNNRKVTLKSGEVVTVGTLVMVNSANEYVVAVAAAGNLGVAGFSLTSLTGDGTKKIEIADGDVVCTVSSNAAKDGDLLYASSGVLVDETQGANQPIAGRQLGAAISATQTWLRVSREATK